MQTKSQAAHLRNRRRITKLSALGILFATACFFHPWLLQGLAMLVVADNPKSAAPYLVLYNDSVAGDIYRIYDAAAKAYREDPRRRILLIEPRAYTLQRCDILPGFVALSRRELSARGVADSAMEEINGAAPDFWHAVRSLKNWLQNHPETEAVFYCFRFESRYRSYVVRQVLVPDLAGRVSFYAIPALDYDETNWWKSRNGVKDCMFAHLLLLYARFHGEPEDYVSSWNPDEFKREANKP
jgi:hypothetical protein